MLVNISAIDGNGRPILLVLSIERCSNFIPKARSLDRLSRETTKVNKKRIAIVCRRFRSEPRLSVNVSRVACSLAAETNGNDDYLVAAVVSEQSGSAGHRSRRFLGFGRWEKHERQNASPRFSILARETPSACK